MTRLAFPALVDGWFDGASRRTREGVVARICLLLAPLFAVSVGGLLRAFQLNDPSLWFDEGFTAWIVSLPTGEMLRAIASDTSPPGYYLLLKVWTIPFGTSEAGLRGLSVACGMGTVALTWTLARRVVGHSRAANVAAWLSAGSFLLVMQSRDARFYSLLGLLVLAALIALHAMMTTCSWRSVICFSSFTTFALYTHNIALPYWVMMQLLAVLIPSLLPWKRRLFRLGTSNLLILILYLPWLPTFLSQLLRVQGGFWASVPTPTDFCRVLGLVAGVNMYDARHAIARLGMSPISPADVLLATTLALVGGAVLGIRAFRAPGPNRGAVGNDHPSDAPALMVRRPSEDTSPGRSMLCWWVFVAATITAVYVYSHVSTPIFMERIFTPLCGVVAVAMSAPLASSSRWIRQAGWGMVGLLLILSTTSTCWRITHDTREDWREAVAFAQSRATEDSLVVFYANEGELLYDFYRKRAQSNMPRLTGVPVRFHHGNPPRAMLRLTGQNDFVELDNALTRRPLDRVTLFLSHGRPADQLIVMRYLLGKCHPEGVFRFDGITLYDFSPLPPTAMQPVTEATLHKGPD